MLSTGAGYLEADVTLKSLSSNTFTWPSSEPANIRGAAAESGPARGDMRTQLTVFWKFDRRRSSLPPLWDGARSRSKQAERSRAGVKAEAGVTPGHASSR